MASLKVMGGKVKDKDLHDLVQVCIRMVLLVQKVMLMRIGYLNVIMVTNFPQKVKIV